MYLVALHLNTSEAFPMHLHLHFEFMSSVEDGRSGTFVIGNDRFPASLLDLPCIVESYKTYDDNVLIKTGDIGQVILPFGLNGAVLCWG